LKYNQGVTSQLAKETDTALKIWRTIFVTVLVVLGGCLGYLGAGQLMAYVLSHGTFNGSGLVSAYRDILTGNQSGSTPTFAAGTTAIIGFTLLGLLVTFLVATTAFDRLVRTGDQLRTMPANEKVAWVLGMLLGLLVTLMLSPILLTVKPIGVGLTIVLGIAFVYLGVMLTTSMKDDIRFPVANSSGSSDKDGRPDTCKILDTNVIIDGRVADICRTGFLDGPIYVPGFVLDELQHIADSSDSLKRARGRRGLDILNQMRTELKMLVRTYDNVDPNDRDEVDSKLVKLAKELNGAIVTNDFNLNKVAELQGVKVLNINELANALKPVVLPGEEMTVTIIKEGKEMNQGVAYLDDGTMIVVEGARRRIGETLDVVTSSVLQTVAGKMIFASIRNEQSEEEDEYDRNLRAYPRSGPRRKIQH
jgi:uncharacterized protein YacL